MGNLISGEVIFKEKAVITLKNYKKAYGWNCSLCTGLASKVSVYHPWPSGLGTSSKLVKLMAIYSLLIPGLDPGIFFMCTLQTWREIKNMWEISQALRKYLQNTAQLQAHAQFPFTTHMERGRKNLCGKGRKKKPPQNVNCKHRVWCPQSFASWWTSPSLQGWISQCTH